MVSGPSDPFKGAKSIWWVSQFNKRPWTHPHYLPCSLLNTVSTVHVRTACTSARPAPPPPLHYWRGRGRQLPPRSFCWEDNLRRICCKKRLVWSQLQLIVQTRWGGLVSKLLLAIKAAPKLPLPPSPPPPPPPQDFTVKAKHWQLLP
jgi:hypothetical protein